MRGQDIAHMAIFERFRVIPWTLGILASLIAVAVGWTQLGGPVPATQNYVNLADEDLKRSDAKIGVELADLSEFAVDTRILILLRELSSVRQELLKLENDAPLSPAGIRLKFQFAEEEQRINRQLEKIQMKIKGR